MDWKAEIEAAVQAGVKAAFERYASVEEPMDEMARRRRRYIELAEDTMKRDPVWAEKVARRRAASSTSPASASVVTACALRDGKLVARPPTTCSTQCRSRDVTVSMSATVPAATSVSSRVTIGVVPEGCCYNLEPTAATSTPTCALDISAACSTAGNSLTHDAVSSTSSATASMCAVTSAHVPTMVPVHSTPDSVPATAAAHMTPSTCSAICLGGHTSVTSTPSSQSAVPASSPSTPTSPLVPCFVQAIASRAASPIQLQYCCEHLGMCLHPEFEFYMCVPSPWDPGRQTNKVGNLIMNRNTVPLVLWPSLPPNRAELSGMLPSLLLPMDVSQMQSNLFHKESPCYLQAGKLQKFIEALFELKPWPSFASHPDGWQFRLTWSSTQDMMHWNNSLLLSHVFFLEVGTSFALEMVSDNDQLGSKFVQWQIAWTISLAPGSAWFPSCYAEHDSPYGCANFQWTIACSLSSHFHVSSLQPQSACVSFLVQLLQMLSSGSVSNMEFTLVPAASCTMWCSHCAVTSAEHNNSNPDTGQSIIFNDESADLAIVTVDDHSFAGMSARLPTLSALGVDGGRVANKHELDIAVSRRVVPAKVFSVASTNSVAGREDVLRPLPWPSFMCCQGGRSSWLPKNRVLCKVGTSTVNEGWSLAIERKPWPPPPTIHVFVPARERNAWLQSWLELLLFENDCSLEVWLCCHLLSPWDPGERAVATKGLEMSSTEHPHGTMKLKRMPVRLQSMREEEFMWNNNLSLQYIVETMGSQLAAIFCLLLPPAKPPDNIDYCIFTMDSETVYALSYRMLTVWICDLIIARNSLCTPLGNAWQLVRAAISSQQQLCYISTAQTSTSSTHCEDLVQAKFSASGVVVACHVFCTRFRLQEEFHAPWYPRGFSCLRRQYPNCKRLSLQVVAQKDSECFSWEIAMSLHSAWCANGCKLCLWEIAWPCCADGYRIFLWEIAWMLVGYPALTLAYASSWRLLIVGFLLQYGPEADVLLLISEHTVAVLCAAQGCISSMFLATLPERAKVQQHSTCMRAISEAVQVRNQQSSSNHAIVCRNRTAWFCHRASTATIWSIQLLEPFRSSDQSKTSDSNTNEKASGELVSDWEDLDDNDLQYQFTLSSSPDVVSQHSSHKHAVEQMELMHFNELVVNSVNEGSPTCNDDMLVNSHKGIGNEVQNESVDLGLRRSLQGLFAWGHFIEICPYRPSFTEYSKGMPIARDCRGRSLPSTGQDVAKDHQKTSLSIPWDPGGAACWRLEGKPHSKEGGMLATYPNIIVGRTMGRRHWTWPSDATGGTSYIYQEIGYRQLGLD